MAPFFKFMTGAHQYRIEADTREQAIQFILGQLQPDEAARAVILNTLYEESEAARFVGASDPENPDTD